MDSREAPPSPPPQPPPGTIHFLAAATRTVENPQFSPKLAHVDVSQSLGLRKRGRPRKYPIGHRDSSIPRPRKKQLNALGPFGGGFTPDIIFVGAGEDIVSKIMAFSQQGPRTVCVLSANGTVNNVTLRQVATTGGTAIYEGPFEIITLSGSILMSSDNNVIRRRTGGLSVSLAGPDGQLVGGGVAGMLIAATPVQIVVGSFKADGKPGTSPLPPPSFMFNVSATVAAASPSADGSSSESTYGTGRSS